jgi:protein involved in sex pheromone biosynthesis
MKKYMLILVTIFISGCSNFQSFNEDKLVTKQSDDNQVCKRVTRHKSVITKCWPRTDP